jgi:hypothetical protein
LANGHGSDDVAVLIQIKKIKIRLDSKKGNPYYPPSIEQRSGTQKEAGNLGGEPAEAVWTFWVYPTPAEEGSEQRTPVIDTVFQHCFDTGFCLLSGTSKKI